ncbi:hypothetical protein C9374_011298 [Naegleria lovaniensis]|uniref:DEP domain-containing protein n=1 Tax=Naegleria lovaniensis TaxID=51637 RepID=A0AA88KNW7_NAELO|nr:uncharacterized protein C9374_011298 [Naegleria lovaniensis]KAG2392573.1 hypothetical protein C9374_011298 [Naegleria lovaniensis]
MLNNFRRFITSISSSADSHNSSYSVNIDYIEIPIEEWSHKVVMNFLYKEQFFELMNKVAKLKYEGPDLLKTNETLQHELSVHEDEITELLSRVERVKLKQGYYRRKQLEQEYESGSGVGGGARTPRTADTSNKSIPVTIASSSSSPTSPHHNHKGATSHYNQQHNSTTSQLMGTVQLSSTLDNSQLQQQRHLMMNGGMNSNTTVLSQSMRTPTTSNNFHHQHHNNNLNHEPPLSGMQAYSMLCSTFLTQENNDTNTSSSSMASTTRKQRPRSNGGLTFDARALRSDHNKGNHSPKTTASPLNVFPPTASPPTRSQDGTLQMNEKRYELLKETFKKQLKESQLLAERSYRLQKYKNCFTGSDATSLIYRMISEGIASATRFDAIDIGNKMIKDGFIKHVLGSEDFKDESMQYYIINEDKTVPEDRTSSSKTLASAIFVEEDRAITKDITTPATTDLIMNGQVGKKILTLISNPDTLLEALVFSPSSLSEKEKQGMEIVKKKISRLKYPVSEVQLPAVIQDLTIPERFCYNYLNPNRIPRSKKEALEKIDGTQFLTIGLAVICTNSLGGEFYSFALLIGTFLVEFSDRAFLALVREKDYNCVDFIELSTIKEKENIELCLKTVSKCCCKWNERAAGKNSNSKTFVTELFRWIDIPDSTVQRVVSQIETVVDNYPINSKSIILHKDQIDTIIKIADLRERGISPSLRQVLEDCSASHAKKLTFRTHADLDEFCLLLKNTNILNSVQNLLLTAFDKNFFCQYCENINLPNSEPILYENCQSLGLDRGLDSTTICKIDDKYSCAFNGHGIAKKLELPPSLATSEISPSTYQYFPCNIPLPHRSQKDQ